MRPVDADYLLRHEEFFGRASTVEDPFDYGCCAVRSAIIESAPTIQKMNPVKRGRWIELPKALNKEENPCKCSECGHVLSFYGVYKPSDFCPNCGAKMIGDADMNVVHEDAEKLLHTNIYDLLCRMQINLDNLLPSVECNFCVLDLIGIDTDAYCNGDGECEKCLQKFMNEEEDEE